MIDIIECTENTVNRLNIAFCHIEMHFTVKHWFEGAIK